MRKYADIAYCDYPKRKRESRDRTSEYLVEGHWYSMTELSEKVWPHLSYNGVKSRLRRGLRGDIQNLNMYFRHKYAKNFGDGTEVFSQKIKPGALLRVPVSGWGARC